ncbi:ATP-binding cassette domain-containing protein [Marivirga salinae]|uniref:ATP-binding cassette domain-containing protein n=1 Tax=Marivirga salinarum TaxID=3059078 RepID=A0AA51NDQ7_9BACT|nr:ATP-binding cassette domain-containing protein [Marivirga sp. BDSF4-3]WMN11770.1 ATP-binding cassette domain-containing protein [Marivirga sp. BDSF4-3]
MDNHIYFKLINRTIFFLIMSKLHVDSVIKSFATKQILTDVFISCQKGEIIGLLGRNGTGKSTLLKIIFGSIQADSRFVKIGEKISSGLFDNRKLIKYLPQDNFLPNHVKVKTIIELFCDKNETELIKKHDLIAPMLNRKSKQLSGGEKRLLEIFLIIYSQSAYTLIDEPFNGIAPVYKEAIKDLIKKQSVDKGFIITDHDYRNILDMATRIVIIHDGGTKEIKSKKELIAWGYIPETA